MLPHTKEATRKKNFRPINVKKRRKNREDILNDPVLHEASKKRGMAWFMANKKSVYAYRRRYEKENPSHLIGTRVRTYLYQKIGKKQGEGSRFKKLLGCSLPEFRAHLERHWEPWMNWDNYGKGDGKWSIDHTVPVAAFDLTDEAQLLACFNYKNLKPMAWRDNLMKRDKLVALQ